jgi:hypothetical protein
LLDEAIKAGEFRGRSHSARFTSITARWGRAKLISKIAQKRIRDSDVAERRWRIMPDGERHYNVIVFWRSNALARMHERACLGVID